MDNQNSSNSSNNTTGPFPNFGTPVSTPPSTTPFPPASDWSSAPTGTSNNLGQTSTFTTPSPWDTPTAQTTPAYPQNPLPSWTPPAEQPAPVSNTDFTPPAPPSTNVWSPFPSTNSGTTTSQPQTTTWTPPIQTPPIPEQNPLAATTQTELPPTNIQPIPATPSSWPPIPSEPASTESVSTSIPTFPPPQTTLASNDLETTKPSLSPLDNPWSAPTQPPPIADSASPVQPSWTAGGESAPTDLSHLISNNNPQQSAQPAPETLVVPSSPSTPEVPSLPVEAHKGIPKWLFGLGAGLLILVIGASAYFILGIGQPTKTTTSLPAAIATQPEAQPIAPVTTSIPQPVAEPTESATAGSANFGELQGNGSQTATSAADLLRQRQQGR